MTRQCDPLSLSLSPFSSIVANDVSSANLSLLLLGPNSRINSSPSPFFQKDLTYSTVRVGMVPKRKEERMTRAKIKVVVTDFPLHLSSQ